MTEFEFNSAAGSMPEQISRITGGGPAYRGRQIFEWIWKGAQTFTEMTNLPAGLRSDLDDRLSLYSSKILEKHEDNDNTVKLLIELYDGARIETVLLTDETGRKTACLSSQVGCAMGCKFCRTALMGLKRNLHSEEIIEQFLHLKNSYGDISNIVYMGMGEPLNNYGEFKKSVALFTRKGLPGLSPRRITVSTCGIAAGIKNLAAELPALRLAVSLVSADPQKRLSLMPVTAGNSLDELKEALMVFQQASGKRLTLECAIMGGINDSVADAAVITRWVSGLNAIVNVIPWNRADDIDFSEPDEKSIEAFCAVLEKAGIPVTRRYRRGRGLNAACGQLAT